MPKKILIVDDDPGICRSLAILLREAEYFVDETTDSEKAAVLLRQNKYDVCLFDYKMKGLNGIDLLKMAKKANRPCSVFIVSGMLHIDELSKKENSGLADGIIGKPFDVDTLLRRIEDITQ